MKVWKNILLLTALPITTFVVPQVLSSCSNVIEKEEKLITYTKFDETNIDSITTLDNNMYDVGLTFGKDIITKSNEENTEIKEGPIKFKHWGDVLDPDKLTLEFIIDLTKMRNLEVIHANLKYFMSGAYQSYCLDNKKDIENLPENPYFKIIFPQSLKKFVYLDGVYKNGVNGFDDSGMHNNNLVWLGQLKDKENELFNRIDDSSNESNLINNYFIKDARYKFDLSKSINLESFQMQDVIVNSNEGFYGELIIPSSVKEFIPPLLTTGLYAVFSQDDVIWWNGYRKRNYDLKILMDKRYVEKSLNIRKQNFINYFLELDKKYEDKIYENRIKFVKYFSLFPMSPFIMDSYYNNIYIDDSFKSIDGLNLLFGGLGHFLVV